MRALALGEEGEVLGVQGRDYAIREPRPGFAEQSPREWWEATADCLRRLLELETLGGATVRSVGLSGQMHGLVLLDREGEPLRDAIIWPDRRTADICREWAGSVGSDAISAVAGLPLATGFMAPSLAWVRRNEPRLYEKAERVLLPKDYIRYRLTGEFATDVTDASGSLMLDVARRRWSDELVGKFGLDGRLLPPILNSSDIAGSITASAAESTGLRAGLPVATGGADIAMTALALGIGRPGTVAVSLSTGGTVITGLDRLALDRRMHTICGAAPGRWILMGATLSAGLSLSWFAHNVAAADGASGTGEDIVGKLAREAGEVRPGAEGLLFAPYLCGERTPYMDPGAKGCFIGLSLRHGRAHMARAIMEGVAYSLGESLDIFQELGVPARTIICSGGGARSPLWRQILADVFDRPVKWLPGEEHSGIGAAMAGALAVGVTLPDATAVGRAPEELSPERESVAVHRRQRAIYKRIHPQLADIFDELSR